MGKRCLAIQRSSWVHSYKSECRCPLLLLLLKQLSPVAVMWLPGMCLWLGLAACSAIIPGNYGT